MLELCDQEQELVQTVGPLKCDLQLPSSWKDYFSQTGPLPGKYAERRRYPRYNFRVYAALQYRQTFPTLARPSVWHKVFTKDVSRGGLSFMHGEPLFPRERMQLVLPGQEARMIEVVWCVRIQEHCFQIGARFVEQSRGLSPSGGEDVTHPATLSSSDEAGP